MTDKLKCPFCGTELNDYPDKTTGVRMVVCRNPKCKYDGWHFPVEIIQRMIDGKKAQRQLRAVKDRCVKKLKAKEFEIHNCLQGIHVRDCEVEALQEKLSQAQDVLKVARNLYQELALAYCEMVDDYRTTYGCLKTPEQETQEYMQEYDGKITSITKQE